MLEQHGSTRSSRLVRLARLARQSRTCRVVSSRVESSGIWAIRNSAHWHERRHRLCITAKRLWYSSYELVHINSTLDYCRETWLRVCMSVYICRYHKECILNRGINRGGSSTKSSTDDCSVIPWIALAPAIAGIYRSCCENKIVVPLFLQHLYRPVNKNTQLSIGDRKPVSYLTMQQSSTN